jgi:hypothetical protein
MLHETTHNNSFMYNTCISAPRSTSSRQLRHFQRCVHVDLHRPVTPHEVTIPLLCLCCMKVNGTFLSSWATIPDHCRLHSLIKCVCASCPISTTGIEICRLQDVGRAQGLVLICQLPGSMGKPPFWMLLTLPRPVTLVTPLVPI